jgi:hypothetical protein
LADLIQRVVNQHVTTLNLPKEVILPVDALEDLQSLEQTLEKQDIADQMLRLCSISIAGWDIKARQLRTYWWKTV